MLRRVLFSILALSCMQSIETLVSTKQRYSIGGWISSPENVLIEKWAPLFETYLTERIGPLYNPPISFELVPFDYKAENDAKAMVEEGKIDFAFHSGGGTSCLEAEFGFTQIATEVQLVEGREESSYGSVIYSLKSNKQIRNISDFAGKRIGVGYPLAPGGFQLGAQYLDDLGLNIYTKFSQVVFYMTDYAGLLNGVLVGDVDVAVTQSGWIESNFPNEVPKLLYHSLINASWHAEPYLLPTTTQLVPNFALSASPDIPLRLQEQVADALIAITASHPAAKAASISRFTLPSSYESTRSLLEKLGTLTSKPDGGKTCLDVFSGLDKLIKCPEGYALEREFALNHACKSHGLSCPDGATCFCKPCHRDMYVQIFPWPFVLGLCCTLFVIGLCFSIVWTLLLQMGHVLVGCVKKHNPAKMLHLTGRHGGKMMHASSSSPGKQAPMLPF